MAMAFLVFSKKRRDREPTGSDDELAATPPVVGSRPNASYARVMAPNAAAVATAVQPPWRRPSRPEPPTSTVTCPAGGARR